VSESQAKLADSHEQRIFRAPIVPHVWWLIGVAILAATWWLATRGGEARRFWLAYVHNFAFVLSLSWGALYFVLLHHVTRSGWSVVVRRLAELMAGNALLLAVLFVPIAINVANGSGTLYPWARPLSALNELTQVNANEQINVGEQTNTNKHIDGFHADAKLLNVEKLIAKRAYLNPTFFIMRWIIYFAVWIGLGSYYLRTSLKQDHMDDDIEANIAATLRMQQLSGPALVAYAVTLTAASFDLLMSLDPQWFSTIFGVYVFSGAAIGIYAVMIVYWVSLQRGGYLTVSVNAEHYHDLGKWLFAFVFFWGYIAFSQYLLIWYGNIPEETEWFGRRGCSTSEPNVWSYVIILILVAHFLVPFAALLSRGVKRRRSSLLFWAVWMLVMHWVDLYWLVMPEWSVDQLPLGVTEIGCCVGILVIYLGGLSWLANGRNLVTMGDPRLPESLAFEQTS